MESHQRNDKRTLKQIEIPVNRQNSEDNRLNECRDLVRDLGKKTEILYRECRYDRDKASQIRAMASTLAALTVIVNRIDMNFRNTIPEILKDTRGFTYRSVRSCDLDRICDKQDEYGSYRRQKNAGMLPWHTKTRG